MGFEHEVTVDTLDVLLRAKYRRKPAPAPVSRVRAVCLELAKVPALGAGSVEFLAPRLEPLVLGLVREVLDELDKHMEERSYLPHGDARRLVSEARVKFLGSHAEREHLGEGR